jgi:hypothetical protein
VAERIESLSPVARQRIYPWPEWLDGSAWRIRRGEDFEVTGESMASIIRLRAQRDGGTAACRVVDGGEVVEFQFYGPDEEAA